MSDMDIVQYSRPVLPPEDVPISDKGKLVDGKVVPIYDTLEWARWYETADRTIGFAMLDRRRWIYVSTVFLGLNHALGADRPLWFETMIFGTSMDGFQRRYPDIESARRGHALAVRYARNARQLRGTSSRRKWKRLRKTARRYLK